MNCFQKSYLWLLNTTPNANLARGGRLWIAFKNLIFDYWTQHTFHYKKWFVRCELLSKILSLTIEHNQYTAALNWTYVVNCFQKSYLWLLNTTVTPYFTESIELWIAFKNLIFDYWTQHILTDSEAKSCCELLSKILSLTIEHNPLPRESTILFVVNCFQKSYLWLLNTTPLRLSLNTFALWIAFKNLIFDYWTQLVNVVGQCTSRCELLSKILSLTIEHN